MPPTKKAEHKLMDLKSFNSRYSDFPKPGIVFRDITTLLRDPAGLVPYN